jgi:hypothetical protein
MVDIRSTLISNSDQLDNIDLASGPRVFTVVGTTMNEGAEQPLSIRLAEFDRQWKPGKTVRRVLDGIWGYETDDWSGRRLRLFRDETVSFGKQKTGGTRISHASHIDKPITLTLPTSKGKFGEFRIEPLIEYTPTASKPDPSKAIEWFATQNVTQANLEAHLSKPVADWDADDMATLDRDRAELVGGVA